ncbi:unnamed protein product [Gongylonema pulchrum]|uniref:Mediator complex subunit 17 n=1 Tax=Gongylonema pulchrum TaxID=637853 RepID=A0A183DSN4_9BILA|nr:unnamed protein product [Gongylonema pulchrum]
MPRQQASLKPMFGAGQQSSSNTQQPAGVNVALEAGSEWEVRKVGPLDYLGRVAKMAGKVDWLELAGADATFGNPDSLPRDNDGDDDGDDADEEMELDEVENVVVGMEDRKTPEAGPWHGVAKYYHHSLQQVNTLADMVAILKTSGMEALTVADTFEVQHNMQDMIQQSKQFQWVTRRKGLGEAVAVFEYGQKMRAKISAENDIEKELFFRELRKMREFWRVRKTGDIMYGDLGYKIFGSKYKPRDLFDIRQRAGISSSAGSDSIGATSLSTADSYLQIQLPCHLLRRASVAVSIETDGDDPKDLFATSENELDCLKLCQEKASEVPWPKALNWAQENLVCKDIFKQVLFHAVVLKKHVAVVRGEVLVVSLLDKVLLRVELAYHPFEDGPLPAAGDAYLNRTLRHLYFNDLCVRDARQQTFVAMPLTTLPDTLDLRGPYAMNDEEVIQSSLNFSFLWT